MSKLKFSCSKESRLIGLLLLVVVLLIIVFSFPPFIKPGFGSVIKLQFQPNQLIRLEGSQHLFLARSKSAYDNLDSFMRQLDLHLVTILGSIPIYEHSDGDQIAVSPRSFIPGYIIWDVCTGIKYTPPSQEDPLKAQLEQNYLVHDFYDPEIPFGNYITKVNWPPQVEEREEAFTCPVMEYSLSSVARVESSSLVTISDYSACLTIRDSGTAGTTYTSYDYLFPKGDTSVNFSFTIGYPDCYHYDEPEQAECLAEQANLDLGSYFQDLSLHPNLYQALN